MKNAFIILLATSLLFSACQQQQKKEEDTKHNAMDHKETNVMMQAMDESMGAMHNAKQTGNADYDFASMMIPHHEGAIVMAEAIVKNGKSATLIDFANKVIVAQKAEVKSLQDYLKTADQTTSKNAAQFKTALNNSMAPMMDGMGKAKLTNDIDKDFIALMIPHHQSAVDMAKAYLPYSNNAQLKSMAEEIIKAQEEEIKWLHAQQ